MSTITHQVEELRKLAQRGWHETHEVYKQINSAADTIEELYANVMAIEPEAHGWVVPPYDECSVCGKQVFDFVDGEIYEIEKPNYCPNCGARLDLKGANNDTSDV